MKNNDKRLFLLDAMALVYRAYFAMIKTPLINSKGINTSAIQGFTNTLNELLTKEKPTHIAVVFDSFAKEKRAEQYEFYKANRQETPRDIIESLPYIKAIIEGFNIPVLAIDGYEADDIIGTLAKKAEAKGYEVYMVTPDKDFGQLVSDKIFIYKPPYQGKGGFEKLGVPEVLKKWDIERVDQVIDVLGLMGDAVDNIPGIPGVGQKTAAKLLKEFGSIEKMYERTDEMKGKLREKIEDNKEQALISKELATIVVDCPLDFDEDDLCMSDPDQAKLTVLFNELEFRSIGKRILGDDFDTVTTTPRAGQMDLFGGNGSGKPVAEGVEAMQIKTLDTVEHDYKLLRTDAEISEMVTQFLKQKSFSIDTETTGPDPMSAELVGVAMACKACEGFYLPIPVDMEKAKERLKALKPLFSNKEITKVGQNLKYDMLMLKKYGLELEGPLFDTMIAHYLIEPDMRHSLDSMAEIYLGHSPIRVEDVVGKGRNKITIREAEVEQVKESATEDADMIFQLKQRFEPLLKERELESLLYDVELPLMEVLAEMEYQGVALDTEFLSNYSKDLEEEIKRLQECVHKAAGMMFNLDSPKQLGDVLFGQMKLPYSGKKTKTGQYSTGEEILSKLAQEHEICRDILGYRELVKLKSTYVDALPVLVNEETGRLHTTFRQTIANTGRLSSQNPNLQNIPIRTERGRAIRKAFIPRDDEHILVSADYSQIELRIIAGISGDEAMIEAFRSGQDIHATTAAKVFGVPLEEVSREMRDAAKTVNFGIIYGISAFGLSQRLGIPRAEGQELINNYLKTYPKVSQYMHDSVEKARQQGYVTTILGRRKYLKDINARNATVRGFAERNAINMPIQGSAADMIKVAMNNIHIEMLKRNLKSKMTLQVHDELVFDAYKSELKELKSIIEDKMKNAIPLPVPIEVEIGAGENWLMAH